MASFRRFRVSPPPALERLHRHGLEGYDLDAMRGCGSDWARVVGLALLLSVRAHGAPSKDTARVIEWDAPDECPGARAVERSIEKWIGQPLGAVQGSPPRVMAHVRRLEARWELDLIIEYSGARGHDVVLAERCATLADLVALKVALLVAPASLLDQLAAHGVPADPPESAPVYSLHASSSAALGPVPDTSLGFGAFGAAEWPVLRLELGAAYYFPRSVRYAEHPQVGADVDLLLGVARICSAAGWQSPTVTACGGLEAGVLRARGYGVPETFTSAQPWVALSLGPVLRVPVSGGFALRASADAVLPLTRPEFHVRNLDRLYQPETTALRAWLGVELALD